MRGIGVSAGRAVAPVHRVAAGGPAPEVRPGAVAPDARAGEAARIGPALEAVAAGYEALAAGVPPEAGEILAADAAMARDPGLRTAAAAAVADHGHTAEAAVWSAAGAVREQLLALGGHLAERAADVDDIRRRAVAVLRGTPTTAPAPAGPHVVVAVELSPADTAALDLERVCAFVTELGGPTGHSAILARMLGVPAVVACPGAAGLEPGRLVAVDGGTGEVDPDPPAGTAVTAPQRRAVREVRWSGALAGGRPLALLANVESGDGAAAAARAGAGGVGLFRTELAFLDRAAPPGVREQQALYGEVFARFPGAPVVVRTLDGGSDKPLEFLGTGVEANPALGVRGLRATPVGGPVLDAQLDAVAAAAAEHGADVRVMAPMVSTPAEAAAFAAAARARGLTAGVMIEVPAAALAADAVVAEVDFVSIGTNDLAQYAFAADRTAGGLADLLDPWQPALLALVAMVGAAGRRLGRPVGVCGEAAADPALAPVLAGLGVGSLSAAPALLPAVADGLAGLSAADCERLARLALDAPDAAAGRERVREELGRG